jgi:hypothetical protein
MAYTPHLPDVLSRIAPPHTLRFMIIGAPKCATSSLQLLLNGHPEIFMPDLKELHFFNSDMSHRGIISETEYIQLFSRVTSTHKAVGEASVWYLFSKVAVPEIVAQWPDTKFIVGLRDPADLAFSLHQQLFNSLAENEPSFRKAWQLQSERRAGQSIPDGCPDPCILDYERTCSLGSQVDRLLHIVPHENVFFYTIKEIERDASSIYKSALDFLGIDPDGRDEFPHSNARAELRSRRLHRLIWKIAELKRKLGLPHFNLNIMQRILDANKALPRRPEDPEDIAFLQETVFPFFESEREKLANLLDAIAGRPSLARNRTICSIPDVTSPLGDPPCP